MLSSVVVIPARAEERRIADCLRALAAQTVGTGAFEVVVVLDAPEGETARVVAQTALAAGLRVRTIDGPGGAAAAAARRAGMDAACERLLGCGRPLGLIACIDGDSRPAPDWLERQLAHVAAGARAIAGLIELGTGHHHFAGASIGVTAATYREIGGLEPPDEGFAARLARHGISVLRASDVRVLASGRARRPATHGSAVARWYERRRYRAADFTIGGLRTAKATSTVTVIIPTRECAATIGGVLRSAVAPVADAGLVDELVVVDAGSADGTAGAAARAGALVLQQDDLRTDLGPALGKGDAMWRALQATGGDLVCFLDGDTSDPSPDHLLGLLGPLLTDPSIELVKGSFDRPLRAGEVSLPHEGGRVTELMARPLINLHEPLLAGFAQPLAGEFAGRRALLEAVPFPVGYGVEIAVLIDALRAAGLDALAEAHLGTRQNRHQSLRALGEMAYAVLAAVEARQERGTPAAGGYLKPWEDGAVARVPVLERPPVAAPAPARQLLAVAPADAT